MVSDVLVAADERLKSGLVYVAAPCTLGSPIGSSSALAGFMAQFGIHANPKVAAEWKAKTMQDDPVKKSNKRGADSFSISL